MFSRVSKSVSRILALACVVTLPIALGAQDSSKPAAKAPAGDSSSRWDIFAGWSYFIPNSTVDGTNAKGQVVPVKFKDAFRGGDVSLSRYFNRNIGWQIDSGNHDRFYSDKRSNDSNMGLFSVQTGPVFRLPSEGFTPWAHALVGGVQLEGPAHQNYTPGITFTLGGGVDLGTPFFHHKLAFRLAEADFEYTHVDFGIAHGGSSGEPYQVGGRANMNSIRLATGFVYHIGELAPPPPVTLACSVSPTSIFPGDPVSATATAGSLDPKLNAIYSWSGTGVTGTGTTASVATAALAPGSYTVKVSVKEGKAGKEGLKVGESADCSASFTVRAYDPPTISCSASPSTIKPGEGSTVTASGVSPQNRPLTYSYSANAGTISGTGTTASFSSTGAPTGPVGITCNVSDDKGQTATANTSVTITAPYVAPIPHTQALCSITFDKDAKRPARVDNEAKACLDEVALDLQRQSDAKAVVVGDATEAEKALPKHAKKHAKIEPLAAERAVNTKDYLVTEKGIDASRISVATGAADGKKVEDYLVPSGATFSADVAGTTTVDETMVKPQARKVLPVRPVAKKKHAAAAGEMAPAPVVKKSVKPPSTAAKTAKKKAAKK